MIRVKYHRMYAHTLNSEFGVRLVILHWLLLPLMLILHRIRLLSSLDYIKCQATIQDVTMQYQSERA